MVFKSIVAATDFSADGDNAAARAAMLAAQHDATLMLIHVVSAAALDTMGAWLHGDATHARIDLLAYSKRTLERLSQELQRKNGCAIHHRVEIGAVLDVLLASACEADLLVVGAYGRRTLRSRVLGTTAQRLLAKSTTPMLVVRAAPHGPYRSPLVPVDFFEHSSVALRFALQVAPDARITLFHAVQTPFEGKLRYAGVSEAAIEDYRSHARKEAFASLALLMNRHAGGRAAARAEYGYPQSRVLEEASVRGADLVVIGKHGKSRVAEFFLGSVTRHVLAEAACDVLVVTGIPRNDLGP